MPKKQLLFILVLFCLVTGLSAVVWSPEDLIDAFFQARCLLSKTRMMILAQYSGDREFTKEGEQGIEKRIISYTTVELKIKNHADAYALVEVRTACSQTGLETTKEYWKMNKVGGSWHIENIFFYNPEIFRSHINPIWPLDRVIDKLNELKDAVREYELSEVVEEIEGTPFEKALFYFDRGRFTEAFEQIDLHIALNDNDSFQRALGVLIKGLMIYQLGDTDRGLALVKQSVRINSEPYEILMEIAQSGSADSSGSSADTRSTTRKRRVQESYNIERMFTK